jgi:predicted esterase
MAPNMKCCIGPQADGDAGGARSGTSGEGPAARRESGLSTRRPGLATVALLLLLGAESHATLDPAGRGPAAGVPAAETVRPPSADALPADSMEIASAPATVSAAEAAAAPGEPQPGPTVTTNASAAAPASAGRRVPVGELVEGLASLADPTQTYTLYLPPGYPGNRRWPALLLFDPRGRSRLAAELFLPAAAEHGWILVSSDNTRSDGPPEPNSRALQALWPEVQGRWATDPRRIYASGFSGGAILAYFLGQRTAGLAGVIAAGGRFASENYDPPIRFPCFGAAGDTDFNYADMQVVHRQLRKWGAPERFEVFHGGHRWMPPEIARLAVDWMEIQAMRSGRRSPDPALAARLFARELEAARGLEAAGDSLWALRRYDAMWSGYEGLVDTSPAFAGAERLRQDPAVLAARREEERWDAWEGPELDRLQRGLAEALAQPRVVPRRVLERLQVPALVRRAAGEGYAAVVAERVLATMATRIGFYEVDTRLARGDLAGAQVALELTVGLRPEDAFAWYNLACLRAKAGARREALAALAEAAAHGFGRRELVASDPDLAVLHDDPAFVALLAKFESP